jgi:fatty acid desaturase
MLCKYRLIFGKEGEGAHSFRIFDIAVFDVLLTFVGGAILAYTTGKFTISSFFIFTLFLFVIGIILHRLFCVNTTINKAIFGIV